MSTITLTRSNPSYAQPLQARINFTTLDNTDTLFTWSPMENVRDLNVMYMDVERAMGETGTFNMVIEDSANAIGKDHLSFLRMEMEFGKTIASLKPYFVGYVDIPKGSRPRTSYQEYVLSGPSSKIQAVESMLLYRKAADDPNNPRYGIGNLVKDMISKRVWRPLNVQDIQEITEVQGGEWNVDLVSEGGGIADELNKIIYSRINESFSTPWDFLERMAAITGANWD